MVLSHVIETFHLTKRFPQPKSYSEILLRPFQKRTYITAIEDVSIRIRKGELFGILGPNGAGKTTLTKTLCTLVLPTEGTALVNGFDVTKHQKEITRMIGYVVSEERSFYWRLTGRRNLQFFATLNNMSPSQANRKIDELAELTGLNSDMDKRFQNYSSGMKQKLAVARGMLTDPEILLLDEPTRNLDPIATHNVRNFLKNVVGDDAKKTVVIATNDMQEAETLCERIAIFHRGKLRLCGSLGEVKASLGRNERYVMRLNAAIEHVREAAAIWAADGEVVETHVEPASNQRVTLRIETKGDERAVSRIVERIVRSGIPLEACHREELSLADVFTRAIGE
jgi:ABC-2 type transport system ATP-binding protein